ncbi:MAG TPA: hypothetical protein VM287_16060 [Egibacteraceae bacterium]|nr:hypothetical protein [Egibacteraceae bacterium]
MKRMLVAMIAVVLALGACDGGEDAAMDVADPERYCEVAQSLDQAGEEEIEVDFESATPDPETVRAEFSDFVADHAEEMDEAERLAPPEIADDVAALNETIRTVAETGDLSAFDESEEGDQRIREFESRVCGTDS